MGKKMVKGWKGGKEIQWDIQCRGMVKLLITDHKGDRQDIKEKSNMNMDNRIQ